MQGKLNQTSTNRPPGPKSSHGRPIAAADRAAHGNQWEGAPAEFWPQAQTLYGDLLALPDHLPRLNRSDPRPQEKGLPVAEVLAQGKAQTWPRAAAANHDRIRSERSRA